MVPHPLIDVIVPQALQFTWLEHDGDLVLGPFTIPANVPVPVAAAGNDLARGGWLHVPFAGRPPIPGGIDGEGSEGDGEELLRAFVGGHLQPGSPDHRKLVDEVARCLLIHSTFCEGADWCDESRDIFARADEAAKLFELLISRAKSRIGEGVHFIEQKDGERAMYEYLIARLLYYGAHLLSPTTPGVLYEMGVLTHDLAHQLKVEDGSGEDRWRLTLAREAVHYLMLSLNSEAVRDETPAHFLVAANREVLGDTQTAEEHYRRFLDSPAVDRFGQIGEAARQRLQALET